MGGIFGYSGHGDAVKLHSFRSENTDRPITPFCFLGADFFFLVIHPASAAFGVSVGIKHASGRKAQTIDLHQSSCCDPRHWPLVTGISKLSRASGRRFQLAISQHGSLKRWLVITHSF